MNMGKQMYLGNMVGFVMYGKFNNGKGKKMAHVQNNLKNL